MSKNYKVILYIRTNCPPCEDLGAYPSDECAKKGYTFEKITVTGYSHHPLKPKGLIEYPWYVLQDRDKSDSPLTSITDSSIIDNFYGSNKARFDLMLEK